MEYVRYEERIIKPRNHRLLLILFDLFMTDVTGGLWLIVLGLIYLRSGRLY